MLVLKNTLAVLLLLATVGGARAQSNCLNVKVLRNKQEVPSTGSALAPEVTVLVSPGPACPDKASYQFTEAELTLVRAKRPIAPIMLVKQARVDLSAWMSLYQPGDRIFVFVQYKNLIVVSADGKRRPYLEPKLKTANQNELSAMLKAEDQQGISFNWILLQK